MNGTRFQRGHLYEAFGSFHVKFYQTEVVDSCWCAQTECFRRERTYGKWPIQEISQQKSSAISHPSSLRVGRLCVRVANWNRCRRSYPCGHAGM